MIVIEDDCDATTFQCRSAQERFAHAHHVKCDLDQKFVCRCSSSHVREPFFVHIIAVPRCSLPQPQRLQNPPPEIAVQTKVDRHVRNIQIRASTRAPQSCNRTDLFKSSCADVSCCPPARISRVPHLRIQSCSLETNLIVAQTCCGVSRFLRLVHCCRFHCFLSLWILTSQSPCLRLGIWAAVCTNNQQLCARIFRSFDTHPRIAGALLSFTPNLALGGFSFAFPFPGDGIDFHRIFIVCVSG